MIENNDLKVILQDFSVALLIAKPIYSTDGNIEDWDILYVNNAFKTLTHNLVTKECRFSDFVDKISVEIPWREYAAKTSKNFESVETTFFSIKLNNWLKIKFQNIIGYTVLIMNDMNLEKEHELQLRKQNMRLGTLTEQLSISQKNLKGKLENIEVLNNKLQFLAYHDTLTNLYNRAWLDQSIKNAVQKANVSGSKFGLMLIDIDDMKFINDSQGHNAGDNYIKKMASVLKNFFERDNITPFRFGGDEFVILAQNIETRDYMITIGDALLEKLNPQGINISAGIAIYPDDTNVEDELMKFADMAMFDVKKNGKNNISFFHQVMQEKFLSKIKMRTHLDKAMADKSFQLYFQPQFDIMTNTLRGFEALLRWHDDELGWISPDQFIPVAEESLLIVQIGNWVLDTAISTLAKWEKQFNFDGIMSVNVSPVQLSKSDFLQILSDKVNYYGITPRKLEIEITEGVLIDNMQEAVRKLNYIRDNLGLGISLDDFGTGYSSLRYLQILPLTTLKIDKSFIANINEIGGFEANITDSIIRMVTQMGMDTIAEGVETKSQLDALKKINCRTIQGFLKGKPMPGDLCEKVLAGDESAILSNENHNI